MLQDGYNPSLNRVILKRRIALQESYCLDVYTGYDTSVEVERLIKYLRNTATGFGITKGQRGRMGGRKVLRVMTTPLPPTVIPASPSVTTATSALTIVPWMRVATWTSCRTTTTRWVTTNSTSSRRRPSSPRAQYHSH